VIFTPFFDQIFICGVGLKFPMNFNDFDEKSSFLWSPRFCSASIFAVRPQRKSLFSSASKKYYNFQ